jgi:GR25 family glycosyltransferase involved in LPS biosynthesis
VAVVVVSIFTLHLGRKMAKKMTRTMKLFIAMSIFYFSGLVVISVIRCYCSTYNGELQQWGGGGSGSGSSIHIRSVKQQSLDDFSKARPPVSEVYVISLDESKFNVFEQRNFDIATEVDDDDNNNNNNNNNEKSLGGSTSLEWFKGYNGMNQTVLDEWSKITGLWTVNATDFEGVDGQKRKEAYASPHAVGCYLSHWRLLEKAQKSWKKQSGQPAAATTTQQTQTQRRNRPDMMFVFEDDAHCVSNLIERTWSVVQRLPKDWDILYIGGKPMSFYTNGKTLAELSTQTASETENNTPRPSDQKLLEGMCKGDFGKSYTGPYPAGTSKEDSIETILMGGATTTLANDDTADPPYWQVKYVLNTHAYVINPKRIRRVLRVLSEPKYDYKPVDVMLAYDLFREFMNPVGYENIGSSSSPLTAYLTPNLYCDQEANRRIINRNQPPHWEGYHWLPWQTFTGFPNSRAYVWGTTANRKTCRGILNNNATNNNK